MTQLRNKEQKKFNGILNEEDCILLQEIIQSCIFPPLHSQLEVLAEIEKSLIALGATVAVAVDKNTRALEEIARMQG